MSTGVVKFYNEDKKFGFIVDDESGKDYFVHVSAIESEGTLVKDDRVKFNIVNGKKGLQAANVVLAN